jgi:hypothetical protein
MPSFFFNLKNPLQAHSKAKQVDHKSNSILLLKELAKIKYKVTENGLMALLLLQKTQPNKQSKAKEPEG